MNTLQLREDSFRSFSAKEFIQLHPKLNKLAKLQGVYDEPPSCPYPALFNSAVSEQNRVLCILEEYGFQPKVFCTADIHNFTSEFEVIASECNWIVTPLKGQLPIEIPDVFIDGLKILLENRVQIESVAIAKPKPREKAFDVVKQEIFYGAKTLLQIVLFSVFLISKTAKGLVSSLAKTLNQPPPVRYLYDPDPVLLVKIQDKWIEIGRWV